MVEGAGKNLDTIMLTKAMRAADVQFVDLLLTQLEAKLKLERRDRHRGADRGGGGRCRTSRRSPRPRRGWRR